MNNPAPRRPGHRGAPGFACGLLRNLDPKSVQSAAGLFFGTVLNVAVGSVRREEEGQASGANNAARELGGVFGVTVLAAVFASAGGYGTSAVFVDGLILALSVGAAAAAGGALAALAIPRRGEATLAAAISEAA